jgi:hypothetical protein
MNDLPTLRKFYRRLSMALPDEAERVSFESQISRATIANTDEGHDRFAFGDPPDDLALIRIPANQLDATYPDEDGKDVNVIVHFVDGLVSWAERYRDLGDPVVCWPPADDVFIRFPRC